MSLETSFKGKSVLITGAGNGIGRALTQRLHSYGAKVYAVSRSKAPLDTLAKECPNVIPIQLDIGASWNETRKIVDEMKDLDIVINNAATMGMIMSILDVTEDVYDKFSDVNVKAVINVSQIAAKNMIAGGRKGTIINISSICALRAFDSCAMYCTTKAALDMLTKCMALELGKHSIRVNSMNLGTIKTAAFDETSKVFDGDDEKLKANLKHSFSKVVYGHDFLPMQDVVNTILFTASDLACTLTGSCIVLDGGYTLS